MSCAGYRRYSGSARSPARILRLRKGAARIGAGDPRFCVQCEEALLILSKHTVVKVMALSNQAQLDSAANGICADRGRAVADSKLVAYLRHLNFQEKTELVALMWLGRGRGDESRGDWPLLIKRAKQFGNDQVVAYLAGKPDISAYLWKGLKKMSVAAKRYPDRIANY